MVRIDNSLKYGNLSIFDRSLKLNQQKSYILTYTQSIVGSYYVPI